MRPLRLVLSLGLVLVAAPSRADVVQLKNGRQIRGEVLEETSEQVVVKTPDGRVTLPAREVERVEREARPALLLGLAREAARLGDRERARRLYVDARAAADGAGDALVSRHAGDELQALEALPAPAPALDGQPPRRTRLEPGVDPFLEEERQALVRELTAALPQHPELRGRLFSELYNRAIARHRAGECRLAVSDWRRAAALVGGTDRGALLTNEQRCRLEVAARALRAGDGALGAVAAEPVRSSSDEGLRRRAHYLHGRALETTGRPDEARQAFLAALAPLQVPKGHDLAILRELARLRTAGVPVESSTPGVGAGWRRSTSASFELIHRQETPTGGSPEGPGLGEELATVLEQARGEVVTRLQLQPPRDRGKVAVFFLPTLEEYRASPGANSWSAGHAARLRTEDEVVRTIYLYPGPGLVDRARHEIAHIVVGDALDDAPLPAWANEGAAIFAEGDGSRASRRQVWVGLRQAGQLRPLEDTLAQMLPPLSDDVGEVQRFYVQAALNFEAIAAQVGPERALRALVKVNDEGHVRALSGAGVRVDNLQAVIEGLAAGR